jgi:hypothetical protein
MNVKAPAKKNRGNPSGNRGDGSGAYKDEINGPRRRERMDHSGS